MDTAIYISALMLGLASSLHCLGMCGPMVMAVPFSASRAPHLHLVLYLLSKALAYAVLGAVFGMLGLGLFLFEWQQVLSVIAGIIILLFTFSPFIKKQGKFSPFRQTTIRLFQKISKEPRWYYFPILGFLNGWLPCGMVYVALAAALASGHPADGAAAMFLFGIGTAPILFATVVLKSRLSAPWRMRLRPLTTIVSVCVAVLLILRGMDLGIPMISPHLDKEQSAVSSCCG